MRVRTLAKNSPTISPDASLRIANRKLTICDLFRKVSSLLRGSCMTNDSFLSVADEFGARGAALAYAVDAVCFSGFSICPANCRPYAYRALATASENIARMCIAPLLTNP